MFKNDLCKINNSYETDPSSISNGSSTNDESLTYEWDSPNAHEQLKGYLFPTLVKENKKRLSKKVRRLNKSRENSFSMLTSSQESDFAGFNSPVAPRRNYTDKQSAKKQHNESGILTFKKSNNSSTKKFNDSIEFGSIRTYGSEEISDQDIRCTTEMETYEDKLKCLQSNNDLLNVSQFSIESSSLLSDGDVVANKQTKKVKEQNVVETASSALFTLSMNENSSNAVEYRISTVNSAKEIELVKDLSFNGKLKAEGYDQQTNAKSTTNKLEQPAIEQQVSERKLNANEKLDKFNVGSQSNLELQLRLETNRERMNEKSPDLFSDCDDDDDDVCDGINNCDTLMDKSKEHSSFANDSINSLSFDDKENGDNDVWERKEKSISKRIQSLLSGVLPPPSVTNVQHDVSNMLALYKKNIELMSSMGIKDDNSGPTKAYDSNGNFVPNELVNVEWPQIQRTSAHGLHYNRTKYTDTIEIMYMKLVERNVGQETGSSFTYNVSMSAKKKQARKAIASPGNRLSHLARRRAIFSSANLQSHAQFSNAMNLGRKPCVIDASKLVKKEKVVTPKRRALGNRRTPGRKTPASRKKSAKKIAHVIPALSTATRETSKRALFLSPQQEEVKVSAIAPELSRRVEKSKRALFSPPRRLERSISNISYVTANSNSSIKKLNQYDSSNCLNRTISDVSINLKRRREANDDGENMEPRQHSKLARLQGNAIPARTSSIEYQSNTMAKASSENSTYRSQQLTASHKQKLLWAVSTVLKKKSITTDHANFNHFASVLAKVVKRLYLEMISAKGESTSTTMLRLADRLVFWVIQGKTVDEIYLDEKSRTEASKNAAKRLSGYIGRDEYAMQTSLLHNKATTNTVPTPTDSINSLQMAKSNENCCDERNPLTNSSSKNNLGMSALRENHDSKSAQKPTNVSFSGRNQKNLSPYNDKARSTGNLNKQSKLLIGSSNSLQSNILKVKRQISFDN